MHTQMFYACDNKEGYISVIVHRDRYKSDLETLGFVDSVDKLTAKTEEPKRETITRASHKK